MCYLPYGFNYALSRFFNNIISLVYILYLAFLQQFLIFVTTARMIVDDTARLQMGKYRNGAQVFEPTLFHITAQPVGQFIAHLALPLLMLYIDKGVILRKRPDIFVKAPKLLYHLQEAFCIIDDRRNLSRGSYHVVCIHDPFNISFCVARNEPVVKSIETFPEHIPLFQHHRPVQSALHGFHQ